MGLRALRTGFLGLAGGPAGLSQDDSFDSNAQIAQDVPVYPFASKWIMRPLLSVPIPLRVGPVRKSRLLRHHVNTLGPAHLHLQ